MLRAVLQKTPAAHSAVRQLGRRMYTAKAESQELFERINNFWFGESDKLHDAGQ
ncbi:hypothetical protein EC988_001388, partial [Linderina pennispora]